MTAQGLSKTSGPRRKRRRPSSQHRHIAISVLSIAVGLAVWWGSVALGLANPVLLPAPTDVVKAIVEIVSMGHCLSISG